MVDQELNLKNSSTIKQHQQESVDRLIRDFGEINVGILLFAQKDRELRNGEGQQLNVLRRFTAT